MKKSHLNKDEVKKLGTFAGVFTPSVLTILGLILFLRLGYVVGVSGIGKALLILLAANSISLLTTLSLSAVATNLNVKKGGDYYLISRTLGPEFGGAIGIVLFLAQSVSIAFYCLGFGEALTEMIAITEPYDARFYAFIALSLLFVLAWLGADWATRFQYGVMLLIVLALTSFFVGGYFTWDNTLLAQSWAADTDSFSFGFVFALFFPAVTGFTQGMSMSGDLENPGKSLPLGSFAAVLVSMLVYFLAALVLAATEPSQRLISDYQIMQQIAYVPGLVSAGIFAATLSSAMASFLGAPRILQSLAADRLFPGLVMFAKGEGAMNNPRRGVLLAGLIALLVIAVGNLNLIAPIVSMFFLISYGLINYATFFEASAASPNFRPRFQFYDFRLSLLGAIGCLLAMLIVDWRVGLIAISILYAIYQYLSRTATRSRWADGRRSYHLSRARSHLLAADNEPEHPRDWRPNILLFSGAAETRQNLLLFSNWIQTDSGITAVISFLHGPTLKEVKHRNKLENEQINEIKKLNPKAFPLIVLSKPFEDPLPLLYQSFGVGPMKANIFLMDYMEYASGHTSGKSIPDLFRLGCNIVLVNTDISSWPDFAEKDSENRVIDVWWMDDDSSRLMLLIAYLISRSENWKGCAIRLLAKRSQQDAPDALENLEKSLQEARIIAEIKLLEFFSSTEIERISGTSDLILMPFKLRKNEFIPAVKVATEYTLKENALMIWVLASEGIDLDAEPEEGEAAELAELHDRLEDAEDFFELANRQYKEKFNELEQAQRKMKNALFQTMNDKEALQSLKDEIAQLQSDSKKLKRRALRAEVKLKNAKADLKSFE